MAEGEVYLTHGSVICKPGEQLVVVFKEQVATDPDAKHLIAAQVEGKANPWRDALLANDSQETVGLFWQGIPFAELNELQPLEVEGYIAAHSQITSTIPNQ